MKKEKEIKFYYRPDKKRDREALALAESFDQHIINPVDLTKEPLTERRLAEIAEKAKAKPFDLIDQNSDYFKAHLKGKNFDDQDLLGIMIRFPEAIKTPILVFFDKVIGLDSKFDLNSLDLAFKEIVSDKANSSES